MNGTTSPISKCTLENPEICRIHGNQRKIKFERQAEAELKKQQISVEAAQEMNNMDLYINAKHMLDWAELKYYATTKGEAELREKISEAIWPDKEALEEKLEAALQERERIEAKDLDDNTYEFPESKLPEAIKRIDKANRKLERSGVEGRFTYTTEEFTEIGEDGMEYYMTRLIIQQPPLNIAGYDFVAAVDVAESGILTRVLPGQSLSGYKPNEMVCDHCGRRRFRKATYLLKDAETGEYKQVGSSCLESFLGVKPHGLWSLNYDMEDVEKLDTGKRSTTDVAVPLINTVAIALAVSDNGRAFKSRARAQDYGTESTADEVKNQLFGVKVEKVDYDEYLEKAKTIIEETKFDGDSDYETNMRSILTAEKVRSKHIGFAASVVSAYNRQQEREIKTTLPINQPALGFIGVEKDKLKDITLTVKKAISLENNYGYHESTDTLLIMRTEDNKEVVWKASGYKDFNPGDKVNMKSGTVKGQDHKYGSDQTLVTRAKLELIEDENTVVES